MEPITLIGVSGAFYLLDRLRDAKQKKEALASQSSAAAAASKSDTPPPPQFTPAQIERFTHVVGQGAAQTRHFDKDILEKFSEALKGYSAVPVDVTELRPFGRVWSIVPKTPGAESAADVLEQVKKLAGAEVLGSLTLVLPLYSPAMKLLFVGGAGIAARCAPRVGSPFAVISVPALPKVAAAAPRTANPAPRPASAPVASSPEPEAEIMFQPSAFVAPPMTFVPVIPRVVEIINGQETGRVTNGTSKHEDLLPIDVPTPVTES